MSPLDDWPAFPIGKIVLNAEGKKEFPGGLPKAWQKTKQKSKDITGNAGIVPGKGRLVIDIDKSPRSDEAMACLYSLPSTTLQSTQSGMFQAFFICEDAPEGNAVILANGAGELRKGNAFVIRPTSKTEQGTEWKFINSLPPATVEWKQITDAFAQLLKNEGTSGKEPEANRSAREILADVHPSEVERVSCVMKLLAAARLKEPKISYKDAVEGIEARIGLDNKWGDFEAKISRKKIEGVLKKYFEKENPNAKKLEEGTGIKNRKLSFLTSKELFNTPKDRGYIVQSLIQKNTVNLLLSPPAGFKSISALDLAISVSNGKEFLGFKTKKGAVAYLDKENNRQLLRDRFQKLHRGKGLVRKKFPIFFLLKEGMLDNPAFVESLAEYVKENKIRLLIFDTLVRFNAGEENSARDMNLIYQAFVELQRETEAAILFLHHTNRAGEYRGSSDLMGQVDTMFSIYRKPKSNQFTITNTKNRQGEINDIHAEIVFTDDTITLTRNEEVAEEEEAKKYNKFKVARAFILNFARTVCPTETHSFERGELMTALKAWNLEQPNENTLGTRLADDILKHLTNVAKVLRKGDKRGQYYLNNAQNEKITNWIAPIRTENTPNSPTSATTQNMEVA